MPMLGVKRGSGRLLPSWQKRLSRGYSQAAPATSPQCAVACDCGKLNITIGRRHFVFRADQLREDSSLQQATLHTKINFYSACFQTSAAKEMKFALFWDITRCLEAIPSRRFEISYRVPPSSVKKSNFFLYFLTLEYGTDRLSRNVGKKLALQTRNIPEHRYLLLGFLDP